MPIYRVSKNTSTSHRRDLVQRVSTLGEAVVMLCSPYIMSSIHYIFSSLSLKCSKCIRHKVIYNRNAFIKGFNKIKLEKKKLKIAYQLALKQATLKSI
jgi:hypothetical protein